eukprot:c23536_g1_i1 orf=57-2033(+)
MIEYSLFLSLMDCTTQPLRLPHCCQSHGQLQKLAGSRRRELSTLACVLSRNRRAISKPIKHKGPIFIWARPSRPCSVSARSSSQPPRVEPSLCPSLSERPSDRIPALASSQRPNESVPPEGALASEKADEDILGGAHALEESNVSAEGGVHASEKRNESILAVVDAPQRPNGSLLASTHSSERPSLQHEDVLPASHASGRENKGIPAAASDVADAVVMIAGPWDRVPRRYKLIFTTSLAFVICNMDKVNLSVAIIPMSNQLHWNASTAGLVQSSFFWGYALSQIPGGWFARWFTGEVVLGAGVLIWSFATAAVPIAASFLPALLFSRLIVGLGEGVSPSAATDLIARNVPATERTRAVAFVFTGLNVGSVIGLVLAPAIIERFGWESVFYIFGVIGIVWCIGFAFSTEWINPWESWDRGKLMNFKHSKKNDTYSLDKTTKKHDSSISDDEKIPWKAFFKSPPVWAMIYTHFCGNWGHYCILAWLPTYLSEELNLDLRNAALVAILPPLGGMFVSGFVATMADHLITKGVNTTFVRKLCQTIAFLSPTAGMTLTSLDIGLSPLVTVGIITSSLAFSSFALGGLYCTHQDISPKYASILLGITNTAGAIPGVLGVYLTGVIFDQTHSWTMALFVPCIFFWITGTFVWNIFASSESLSFED